MDNSENVSWSVDDKNVLHITIDLNERLGRTKMGNGEIVATSRGWIQVTKTIGVNLNVVESRRMKARMY